MVSRVSPTGGAPGDIRGSQCTPNFPPHPLSLVITQVKKSHEITLSPTSPYSSISFSPLLPTFSPPRTPAWSLGIWSSRDRMLMPDSKWPTPVSKNQCKFSAVARYSHATDSSWHTCSDSNASLCPEGKIKAEMETALRQIQHKMCFATKALSSSRVTPPCVNYRVCLLVQSIPK